MICLTPLPTKEDKNEQISVLSPIYQTYTDALMGTPTPPSTPERKPGKTGGLLDLQVEATGSVAKPEVQREGNDLAPAANMGSYFTTAQQQEEKKVREEMAEQVRKMVQQLSLMTSAEH